MKRHDILPQETEKIYSEGLFMMSSPNGDQIPQIDGNYYSCIMFNPELPWWRGLILHPNLDNRICAKPSVQARYDMISKTGCLVTLLFNPKPNPQVRTDIAAMLLAAFETRRKDLS